MIVSMAYRRLSEQQMRADTWTKSKFKDLSDLFDKRTEIRQIDNVTTNTYVII